MGARSRNKGARCEREVCRVFAAALGGTWSRAPLSGGWANRAAFETCGDVITTLPDFPFTIECKNAEGWHLEQLLTSPDKCAIRSWWRQACRQATEAGKKPLLVFTRNFQPLFVLVRALDVSGIRTPTAATFTIDADELIVLVLDASLPRWLVRSRAAEAAAPVKPLSTEHA